MKHLFLCTLALVGSIALAQHQNHTAGPKDKFQQMYDLLATPNAYRTASGAPGPSYYQQQADYKMDIEIDDEKARLYGLQTVTYHNNSPDALEYLWMQLDQNMRAPESQSPVVQNQRADKVISAAAFSRKYLEPAFEGGFKIEHVKDAAGKPLPFTINYTMMRIDLPEPLKPGQKVSFSVKWWYNINNYMIHGGRSGYEYFPEDDNRLYVIAQFYPRMAVYNDVEGWQNMQFWGAGEFALPFGNFDVNITVPSDHFVEATGSLQNRSQVYTKEQLKRWQQAEKSFDKPVIIVTQAEAEANEKSRAKTKKTWKFSAENVRDFGISSSRKFICDAMAVRTGKTTSMAISLYPKEGNPLWEQYSTRAVAHTLKTYSKYTFDYPYPKAVSVSAQDQGMEYPMISWNFGRPDPVTKQTSDRVKWGMIGVIIHEVGHNFFPMIVNSDERQWTWMDEGMNTFLEYLTSVEFDPEFPIDRGPAHLIVPYMKGDPKGLEPIMSNSESIRNFGANAYGKPATALAVLRQTVMGPELFDHAFKVFANRWKFKHPTPEDFFRTMEDASAVDLDWFWRGWFYTIDFTDIGVKSVRQFAVTDQKPEGVEAEALNRRNRRNLTGPLVYMVEKTEKNAFDYKKVGTLRDYLDTRTDALDVTTLKQPKFFYEITFEKPGGLVMPLLIDLVFEDGTIESHRFPAQIWRKNDEQVTRVFAVNKRVSEVRIDPKKETADVNPENDVWRAQ